MEITEKMIERFLNGYCTQAEADTVGRFFESNPELLQKYLTKDWQPRLEGKITLDFLYPIGD